MRPGERLKTSKNGFSSTLFMILHGKTWQKILSCCRKGICPWPTFGFLPYAALLLSSRNISKRLNNINTLYIYIYPPVKYSENGPLIVDSPWFTYWKWWFSTIFHSYVSLPQGVSMFLCPHITIIHTYQVLIILLASLPSACVLRPHESPGPSPSIV